MSQPDRRALVAMFVALAIGTGTAVGVGPVAGLIAGLSVSVGGGLEQWVARARDREGG